MIVLYIYFLYILTLTLQKLLFKKTIWSKMPLSWYNLIYWGREKYIKCLVMNEMYNIDDKKNYEDIFICIQGIL